MSAALLLATLLMTGLGQVAQKLTVEHWHLVAADGWTARLRSPWPWLAL
ncbi:TPA: 4-amino-4-deoxy-L-arabinose-phospho-UDP flippase, partial [Pseudomonas aeruginosa]|nr:4-amino-4-deoxy-L-arabinose-phospho-UDP flippase [Pseudomonas aeruginosa]